MKNQLGSEEMKEAMMLFLGPEPWQICISQQYYGLSLVHYYPVFLIIDPN